MTRIERSQIERSLQLSTPGSTLDTLRRDAIALMPPRHFEGDAAWVEVTETLLYNGPTNAAELAELTPAKLAKMATESLDNAAEEWAREVASLATL